MFVLPIFKGPNAFETIMVQCQLPCVLLTSLEEYKRQGPVAVPFMTMTHYTELQSTKSVVLVRGDIVDPNALTRFEVRCGMWSVQGVRAGAMARQDPAGPCPALWAWLQHHSLGPMSDAGRLAAGLTVPACRHLSMEVDPSLDDPVFSSQPALIPATPNPLSHAGHQPHEDGARILHGESQARLCARLQPQPALL